MRSWLLALPTILLLPLAAGATPRVEQFPERPAPGELFSVRVTGVAHATDGLEAVFDGHSFPLWPEGDGAWEGLAAVDRDGKTGVRELRVVDPRRPADDPVARSEVTVRERTYAVQRLTVKEGMVTLSPEDRERADRENRLIREALGRRSAVRWWSPPILVPVEGPVSSPFGVRRVYNGKAGGYHSGLDLAAPRGTPVHASASGVVRLSGDFFYTGKTVFVDHGHGLFTAYFHLDELEVGPGADVQAGALLGRVGSTGRSTGPHLHWGVYLCGVKVDPLSLTGVARLAAGGGESP